MCMAGRILHCLVLFFCQFLGFCTIFQVSFRTSVFFHFFTSQFLFARGSSWHSWRVDVTCYKVAYLDTMAGCYTCYASSHVKGIISRTHLTMTCLRNWPNWLLPHRHSTRPFWVPYQHITVNPPSRCWDIDRNRNPNKPSTGEGNNWRWA